jgi:hypothetical protein
VSTLAYIKHGRTETRARSASIGTDQKGPDPIRIRKTALTRVADLYSVSRNDAFIAPWIPDPLHTHLAL